MARDMQRLHHTLEILKKICLCVQSSANQSFSRSFFMTFLHESANRKFVYLLNGRDETDLLYAFLNTSWQVEQEPITV